METEPFIDDIHTPNLRQSFSIDKIKSHSPETQRLAQPRPQPTKAQHQNKKLVTLLKERLYKSYIKKKEISAPRTFSYLTVGPHKFKVRKKNEKETYKEMQSKDLSFFNVENVKEMYKTSNFQKEFEPRKTHDKFFITLGGSKTKEKFFSSENKELYFLQKIFNKNFEEAKHYKSLKFNPFTIVVKPPKTHFNNDKAKLEEEILQSVKVANNTARDRIDEGSINSIDEIDESVAGMIKPDVGPRLVKPVREERALTNFKTNPGLVKGFLKNYLKNKTNNEGNGQMRHQTPNKLQVTDKRQIKDRDLNFNPEMNMDRPNSNTHKQLSNGISVKNIRQNPIVLPKTAVSRGTKLTLDGGIHTNNITNRTKIKNEASRRINNKSGDDYILQTEESQQGCMAPILVWNSRKDVSGDTTKDNIFMPQNASHMTPQQLKQHEKMSLKKRREKFNQVKDLVFGKEASNILPVEDKILSRTIHTASTFSTKLYQKNPTNVTDKQWRQRDKNLSKKMQTLLKKELY